MLTGQTINTSQPLNGLANQLHDRDVQALADNIYRFFQGVAADLNPLDDNSTPPPSEVVPDVTEMSLMLAGLDTLEERRAQLTERFFRRSVLREASCLYYLLPDKRDSSVTDRLRRAKTFEPLPARTNKFRNSFIPYCLEHFD